MSECAGAECTAQRHGQMVFGIIEKIRKTYMKNNEYIYRFIIKRRDLAMSGRWVGHSFSIASGFSLLKSHSFPKPFFHFIYLTLEVRIHFRFEKTKYFRRISHGWTIVWWHFCRWGWDVIERMFFRLNFFFKKRTVCFQSFLFEKKKAFVIIN